MVLKSVIDTTWASWKTVAKHIPHTILATNNPMRVGIKPTKMIGTIIKTTMWSNLLIQKITFSFLGIRIFEEWRLNLCLKNFS